jgi:hypothetical protein
MQWEMARLPSILASCCANATIPDRKQLSFSGVFASFNKKIASNTPKQTGHLFRRTGASAGTPFCGALSLAKREPSKRIAKSWRALLREI